MNSVTVPSRALSYILCFQTPWDWKELVLLAQKHAFLQEFTLPETNIAHGESLPFLGFIPSKCWIFHGDLLVNRRVLPGKCIGNSRKKHPLSHLATWLGSTLSVASTCRQVDLKLRFIFVFFVVFVWCNFLYALELPLTQ